jgi:dipeptidyl aminopeptidase/acylaminoacyl peptidase
VPFPGGAGSAQPRFAAASDGTPVLSWLEPAGEAVALRYATYQAGTFAAPREVTSGEDLFVNWADLPSVQPITTDVWAAHWLKLAPDSAGAYHVATAVSADGGRTWSAPVQLNDDNAIAEHGFVELFAWNDRIAAFWLDGRQLAEWSFDEPDALLGTSLRFAQLDYSGAVVAREIVDELVCDCCQPDRAMASAGPIVAYRDRTPEELRDIAVRRYADGRWQEPVAAGADGWHIEGCPLNGPAIAAAGDRVGVAGFTAANDNARVRFAWSRDGAASFEPAVDLDAAGSFGQVGLLLDDAGTAIVTWWRAAADGGTDLALRTVAADGSLGELRVVAHSATGQPVDVPQIIRAGDDVLVAWTSLDGAGAVHVLLVPDPLRQSSKTFLIARWR